MDLEFDSDEASAKVSSSGTLHLSSLILRGHGGSWWTSRWCHRGRSIKLQWNFHQNWKPKTQSPQTKSSSSSIISLLTLIVAFLLSILYLGSTIYKIRQMRFIIIGLQKCYTVCQHSQHACYHLSIWLAKFSKTWNIK